MTIHGVVQRRSATGLPSQGPVHDTHEPGHTCSAIGKDLPYHHISVATRYHGTKSSFLMLCFKSLHSRLHIQCGHYHLRTAS